MKRLGVLATVVVSALLWTSVRADPAETYGSGSVRVVDIHRALREASPQQFKPVGSTSVVFRMRLKGRIDAAFKPQTRRHPSGHLAEVAAYRIGRGLGVRNVTPVVPRQMSVSQIERQLHSEYKDKWPELAAEMITQPDGKMVDGAAIYWIPRLRELGLDNERGIKKWSRWLSQAERPPGREKSKRMAQQVSDLILFDYLVGNWDRWSGGNAQGDPDAGELFVRDHNVAFYEPVPEIQLRRLVRRLKRAERLSKRFVTRLKAMDREQLTEMLSEPGDPQGYAPLSEQQIDSALDRRRTLLSYIAALIDRFGEDKVLSFP